jgi:hypothetical protein
LQALVSTISRVTVTLPPAGMKSYAASAT